jgi:hypothetical protein
VLLRITNLRGVDLSIFDFDYDLQWFALMLTADGEVLGRFGGRDADTPGKYQTLAGLRNALESALKLHAKRGKAEAPAKPMYAEDYPAAQKRPANSCIHCHHVHEFRRDALQQEKRWSLDDVWVYPPPENIGITLDPERGNRVVSVQAKSAADKLGIKSGDQLQSIGATSTASVADVRFGLHKAPKRGDLDIRWLRDAKPMTGSITLADHWRKSDVSWRWSLKSLSPSPGIIGDDLTADERKALGLDAHQLAYRHMNFLTPAGRHAGLQANDVIVGIDEQTLTMTARQFETHIRLHYRVGQEITFNVLRGKERIKVRLKLPE